MMLVKKMMSVPVKEMLLGATMRLLSIMIKVGKLSISKTGSKRTGTPVNSITLHSKSRDLRLDVSDLSWIIRCYPFARVAHV